MPGLSRWYVAASVPHMAANSASAPLAATLLTRAPLKHRLAPDIDVLACPRCGRRLRLMATVEDPGAIRAILAAVARSRELVERARPFTASPDPGHPPRS